MLIGAPYNVDLWQVPKMALTSASESLLATLFRMRTSTATYLHLSDAKWSLMGMDYSEREYIVSLKQCIIIHTN